MVLGFELTTLRTVAKCPKHLATTFYKLTTIYLLVRSKAAVPKIFLFRVPFMDNKCLCFIFFFNWKKKIRKDAFTFYILLYTVLILCRVNTVHCKVKWRLFAYAMCTDLTRCQRMYVEVVWWTQGANFLGFVPDGCIYRFTTLGFVFQQLLSKSKLCKIY